MDTKKLDRWADLLLDPGKRNLLINFKDVKASTAEVIIPDSSTLFEIAKESSHLRVYDPKLESDDFDSLDDEPDQVEEQEQKAVDKKTAYKNQYAPYIRSKNQVLLYNAYGIPMVALKNIEKKARDLIEESGVNVAHLAFGFIHWKESQTSNYTYRAPILLIPVEIEHESAVDPYYINTIGDEIILNPTFAYKLDAEYGIKLPEYEDGSLDEYLAGVSEIVRKLHWEVTSECKIGNFSFLKINMYRDLKDNTEQILQNNNVRALLGEPVLDNDVIGRSNNDYHVGNPLIDLHTVVDADSSQIEAVELAKSGKSFVLQGPPGTGKSQTITNIIAECLYDGKKVLFVSEKLAALNVVFDKLKQVGLSEFCLELHSHKANKKAVIDDLCHTLRSGRSIVSSKADDEINLKEKSQRQLDSYEKELHASRPVVEKSLFELFESYSSLAKTPTVSWPLPYNAYSDRLFLMETVDLLEQYVDFIPSIGYDYKQNPWYGYYKTDFSFQAKETLNQNLSTSIRYLHTIIPVANEITERYGISCQTLQETETLRKLFASLATATLIEPAFLSTDSFAEVSQHLGDLEMQAQQIKKVEQSIDVDYEKEIYQYDGVQYRDILKKQYSGAFSRLFNQAYKDLIGQLHVCKKNGKKPSYKEAVALTERLAEYQSRKRAYQNAESLISDKVGDVYRGIDSDWDAIRMQTDLIRAAFANGVSFGKLSQYTNADYESERKQFSRIASQLSDCLAWYRGEISDVSACFREDIASGELTSILAKYEKCLAGFGTLDNWMHFYLLLSKLADQKAASYVDCAIENSVDQDQIVKAFKKNYYRAWIDTIIGQTPVLSAFNRVAQDRAVNVFSDKDKKQFDINKATIRSKLSANRPSLDIIPSGSPVATLLREGEKKRKQKTVRNLLTEIGDLVQVIKPCFLMSPLSVSTFLAAGSIHFDTIIFDEASQIFPQDAIGAIYRGKQAIVVGDSKQMPPTNFFNSVIEADEVDEEIGDVTDFESILDLCATTMPQLRLGWHYRSRYEQLIAFSNQNFYDNSLVTFPSSQLDAKGIGVDYYHVDGVFDRKSHTNHKEAEFVVNLVYQNFETHPERSLGVVAFSVAQQELIDKLLSKRRLGCPEKEQFFKKDCTEPFFIKNLETVQGDERDTIIFSTAYGIDAQGRMLHNFGPLNRVGGERRLNVAITRAKHNVQLVSSMHYTDIDLSRISAYGGKLLRAYLDYAENGASALERIITVDALEQFDSDFEMEVCDFLRSKGFTVDTQIGCSGYKIDLGVKYPNSSNYVLAIECDGATYHSSKNARDRDRLRQEILERMGWKFYRIWSTDWFRNKQVEQSRLLSALKAALDEQSKKPEVQKTELKKVESASTQYEVRTVEKHLDFPKYKTADIERLARRYLPYNFKGMVKEILLIEAPLSEDLLLRRTVSYFGREKVTSVVLQQYNSLMRGCQQIGIIRQNGFLYLCDAQSPRFRVPGDMTREIKHIAPEELADGMLQILRQNLSAEKAGLYRALAAQCGFARVGKAINDYFDEVLKLLDHYITVDRETISIK